MVLAETYAWVPYLSGGVSFGGGAFVRGREPRHRRDSRRGASRLASSGRISINDALSHELTAHRARAFLTTQSIQF